MPMSHHMRVCFFFGSSGFFAVVEVEVEVEVPGRGAAGGGVVRTVGVESTGGQCAGSWRGDGRSWAGSLRVGAYSGSVGSPVGSMGVVGGSAGGVAPSFFGSNFSVGVSSLIVSFRPRRV
jgi:hypothetical protein